MDRSRCPFDICCGYTEISIYHILAWALLATPTCSCFSVIGRVMEYYYVNKAIRRRLTQGGSMEDSQQDEQCRLE